MQTPAAGMVYCAPDRQERLLDEEVAGQEAAKVAAVSVTAGAATGPGAGAGGPEAQVMQS